MYCVSALVYVEFILDERENDERDSYTETSFETYVSTYKQIYFTLEIVINERGDELVSVLHAHFVAFNVTQLQFKLVIYRRFVSS